MGQRFDSYSFFDGLSMTPVTQVTWADYWRGVIPDGIVAGVGDEMRPYGNSTGMVIYISTGAIMIDNHRAVISTTKALQIEAADPDYDRIDTIVARIVYGNENESYVELDVKTGTAEPDPVAPDITQSTGGIYEVKLAEVTVHAGVVTLTQNDVGDTRNVYAGGEENPSWQNTDSENMVKGDVIAMDTGEEGGIIKCTRNQTPLGVVTSEVIAPGQYGKIETISGKIAEVRCDEDAVTIGDALVIGGTPGLAKAGAGWAVGIASQAKASGIVANVRSLLTFFSNIPVQGRWWVPEGIDNEQVIAAYRFGGVGSMEDALQDIANGEYALTRTSENVTWNSATGFTIPSVANDRAGLNCDALNVLESTIKAAAVRFINASTASDKRVTLVGISRSMSLHMNAPYGFDNSSQVANSRWTNCYRWHNGEGHRYDGALRTKAVLGGNFTDTSKLYIDGEEFATSECSFAGAYMRQVSACTIGQAGYNAQFNASGDSFSIISAVFFNTALTAEQWLDLYQKMKGVA